MNSAYLKFFLVLSLCTACWMLLIQYLRVNDIHFLSTKHIGVRKFITPNLTTLVFLGEGNLQSWCSCSGKETTAECQDDCSKSKELQGKDKRRHAQGTNGRKANNDVKKTHSDVSKSNNLRGTTRRVFSADDEAHHEQTRAQDAESQRTSRKHTTVKSNDNSAKHQKTGRAVLASKHQTSLLPETEKQSVGVDKQVDAHGQTTPTLQMKTSTFLPKSEMMEILRPQRCNGCFNSEFPMLIDEQELCQTRKNQTIDLIFLILTTHRDLERRQAIRQTWASVSHNNTSRFRHVFLLGTTENVTRMRHVMQESRHFRDVLVSGFNDSYDNLTLKTLMGLRWAANNCPHARYFLKVDDDMWVNVPPLLRMLTAHHAELQRGITGYCRLYPNVIRDVSSKWYVSEQYYSHDRYPPYCTGLAYAGGMDVAKQVVAVSRNVPFFFMEDVYVGFCLKELGYKVRHDKGFVKYASADNCMAKNRTVYVMHHVSAWRLRVYWNTPQC